MLAVPVFERREWWGFIGVDDCASAPRRGPMPTSTRSGTVAGALGAAVARDLAGETRRFTEDRYRSMVEHGPAVSYIDAPDEHASTIYVSPQVEALLGYTPQEWYDEPGLWPRLLHPDDHARAIAENERHNETGEPFRMEYRMFHKDGHVRVGARRGHAWSRDERGIPRYSHGVMMDISERKRGEESVAFRAYHDELTGLPSRSMFEELLELSIARAAVTRARWRCCAWTSTTSGS